MTKLKLGSIHLEGKVLHWYKGFLKTQEKQKVLCGIDLLELFLLVWGTNLSRHSFRAKEVETKGFTLTSFECF